MSFGDETFEYDGMGNPTTYRDMECEWEKGRQLKQISGVVDGEKKTVAFTYDVFGIRTSKTVNGTTTHYVYENGKLLRQKTDNDTIDFIYGRDGVIGFTLNNVPYLYRKNLFGDVVEIYNQRGDVVGKYSYTAFGECDVVLDTGSIATKNPIRYRSYYFDEELNLYYLKTRYYDPAVGRFITIDDLSYLDPENISGLNLYAYCGNNPVMGYDPDGRWDWDKFWKALGLAITAIAAIAISVVTFGAGTPLAMTLVAAVTLTAGILTGVNAIATFVEAGTGYNFVRDGIFQGNETAYNWYVGIIEGVAAVGTAVLGVYHTTGRYKASKYGQKLLGKGYKKVGKNRWVSADGTRQLRWDTTHHYIDGARSSNHFNFDFFINAPVKGNDTLGKIHIILCRFGFTTTGWTIF